MGISEAATMAATTARRRTILQVGVKLSCARAFGLAWYYSARIAVLVPVAFKDRIRSDLLVAI